MANVCDDDRNLYAQPLQRQRIGLARGIVVYRVRPLGSRSFKMAIEAKRADTGQRRSPQPKGRKNATPKPVIIADAAAKITEVISGTRQR